MIYDLTQPIITIVDALEELQGLAKAAGGEYTEKQVVKFGIEITRNTCNFDTGLTEWLAKPAIARTWISFKTHFTWAYKNLKAIRGKTIRSEDYHQANMLASQVLTEVKNV